MTVPVSKERQGHALNHLLQIWNMTTKLLLGADGKRMQQDAEESPLLKLSVIWQNGLVGNYAVEENDPKPFDVDQPFIELYLRSVEALRSRKLNESVRSLSFVERVGKGTGLLTLRNAPSRCDDSRSDESVFVPTSALFEPFLALDNDFFTLGALGQFLSRGIWQLLLDDHKNGVACGKALALVDVCRPGASEGVMPSTKDDLLSTHLPSIVGLKTAYAAYRRRRQRKFHRRP
ncbi:hypothetical protein HPB51_011921 [Rhipicephalus microplus]|uniref:Uncharacterized protein n=1 Tax=Rhipicephalus microplus TaxID=6941 RepID=A0A9J6F1E0_RHIMP|nr:hypothetical protein HPB51_011921 [Rhipicephalus microplus]